MTSLTYLYNSRYYRMTSKAYANGSHVIYLEKGEGQRYWQNSTEDRFEEAQHKGKKVAKTITQSKWTSIPS